MLTLTEAYSDCITYLPDRNEIYSAVLLKAGVACLGKSWFVAQMRATQDFPDSPMIWRRIKTLSCTYSSRQCAIDYGRSLAVELGLPWISKVEDGDRVHDQAESRIL